MKEKTDDIDILEEFIKRVKKEQEKYKDNLILQEIEKHCFYGDVPLQAISNLIAENKELKEENNLLKSKLNVWENLKNDDFIPKSKVEEKIKELDIEEKKQLKGMKGQDRYNVKQEFMYKKNTLQSLLGKE